MGTIVKEFDFKSVGIKTSSPEEEAVTTNVPFGIKTPLQLGQDSDGLLRMSYSLREQIKDNLRNLLLTNFGERLGRYNFGGNLRSITFDLSTEQFDNEILIRIKTAVTRYMPYVKLVSFKREQIDRIDNEHIGKINSILTYNVPQINLANEKMRLIFFVGG